MDTRLNLYTTIPPSMVGSSTGGGEPEGPSLSAVIGSVLDSGPLHYWPAIEGEGAPVDIIGAMSTSLVGGIEWVEGAGWFGGTSLVWTDTTTDYVSFSPGINPAEGTPWTYMFVAKFTSVDTVMPLVSHGDTGYMHIVNSEHVDFQYTYPNYITPGQPLETDLYYVVFLTHNDTNFWRLNFNGTSSNLLEDASEMRLSQWGRYEVGGYSMNGPMSHLAYWDRCVSDEEIGTILAAFGVFL